MTIYSKSGDIPTHQYCYVEQKYITGGEMNGVEPCVWFGIVAYTGRVWGCQIMLKSGAVYREVPIQERIMEKVEQLHAALSVKLAEIEEICAEFKYEVTPTLLLRHSQGPSFSVLISNDDLNYVVLCIAELGNIGEVIEEDQG